eukprot:CAMPEP_0167756956 /NCGR_PEP_ID=MMETSP0110_2-20121227/9667_1 /TAXON_ID=629695 /ORGANISM="Gymnochlora sp., Strain CCMP2014" /LENGTH=814 /DNA_ID=CAMNT_0007643111 /DNA_START=463 /DNA_END=2907 /DNA_ORIENTATION=+
MKPYPKEASLSQVIADLSNDGKSNGTTEAKAKAEDEESKATVRLWYLEVSTKTFPYEKGERVEARYNGEWYIGDLKGLPEEDKHGRYSVLCDVDKGKPTPPKTLVRQIRRVTPKEGEGEEIKEWKAVSDRELKVELGLLKLTKSGLSKFMVERKNDGKWIRELIIKDWRDFEVGDYIDCEDTQSKFLPAVIKKVRGGKIQVHYVGYSDKWDEWIDKESDRLAKRGSRCRTTEDYDDDDYGSSYGFGGSQGSVGLRNLGNTCFMNSTLQCMNATPSLTDFFVDGEYRSQINRSAYKSGGRIAEEYGKLVKEMWAQRPHTVTPRGFKAAIGDFAPRFSGYQQQDSQELLACLLEGLHEDLNRIRKKPYDPNPAIGDGKNDEKIAELAWNKYRKREDSVIIDNIYGQIRSQVICPECGNLSVKFDPCGILQVPIPSVETKLQAVTIQYADPSKPNLKLAVSVEKSGDVNDLQAAVAKVANVDAKELISCEVYHNKVYKVFSQDHSINSIMDNDIIYMFEVLSLKSEKPEDSKGIMRVKVNMETGGRDELIFGTPVCIGIPYNDDHEVKAGDVESMIVNALKRNWSNDKKEKPFKVLVRTDWNEFKEISPEKMIKLSRDFEVKAVWDSKEDYSEAKCLKHKSLANLGESEGGEVLTLKACLDSFTKEEILTAGNEYRCPACKKESRGKKKLDLWRLPNILIVQLKRFQYTRQWRDKITTYVDYPLEGLDLATWTKAKDQKRKAVYDLYAVSCHGGGLGGGHYWAYAKNLVDQSWYTLNDSSVKKMRKNDVKTKEAYLLFYARRGFNGSQAAREARSKK